MNIFTSVDLARVSPSAAKSKIEQNQQFFAIPTVVVKLIKAKNGCVNSQKSLHEHFRKDISFWSKYYTQNILNNNFNHFEDLVNEGHVVLQKRINQAEVLQVSLKEKEQKKTSSKSWFENNTSLWIRSYIKLYANKLKKNLDSSFSLDDIESKDIDINQKKISKVQTNQFYEKCKDINPENKYFIDLEKKSRIDLIKESLSTLSTQESNILKSIYFEDFELKFSQKIKKLSQKLNVSDKRIYFIHSQIIKKLKKKLKIKKNIY